MKKLIAGMVVLLLCSSAFAQISPGSVQTRIRPVVDDRIVTYDGTSGFWIQDSGITISGLTNSMTNWSDWAAQSDVDLNGNTISNGSFVGDASGLTGITDYVDFTIFVTNAVYDMQWIRPRDNAWTLIDVWAQTLDSGTCYVEIVESSTNGVFRTFTTNMAAFTATTNSQRFDTWADATWNTTNWLGYNVVGGSALQCSLGIKIRR